MVGFVPIPDDVLQSLSTITGDNSLLPVRRIDIEQQEGVIVNTRGTYFMEENELPIALQGLLHGRAYIIDKTSIPNSSSSTPQTYFIAADKAKGLLIPARSLFVEAADTDAHYRWTDDGNKWTEWTTIEDGSWHTYTSEELCRFAELQIYTDTEDGLITLRASK